MIERIGGAVPRSIHPGAWWAWALALSVVAARVTNPLLLALVVAVIGFVVVSRREDAPWARAIGLYVRLGLLVIAIRIGLRVLFGGGDGPTTLFVLPEIPLPDPITGIRLGGPVSAESLVAAFADGLRLATILLCFGAASTLANPRRLLRTLPNALYEVGAAVIVALSVAPQLAESVVRVRRAQRLRADGRIGVRRLLLPVLEDALDRSISLAAAMDARGYGRAGAEPPGRRRATAALLIAGLVGAGIGMYGLLDATSPPALGAGSLVAGVALLVVGLALAGRRKRHTSYRPDPWLAHEWAVVGSASAAVVAVFVGGLLDPAGVALMTTPLSWPTLPLLPVAGILLALAPGFVTPMPPLRAAAEADARARRAMRASGAMP